MKKYRVVFFVQGLDSGGIENYLLRFLQEMHNNFQYVYIYCKGGEGGQLEKEFLEMHNVRVVKSKIGYFDYSGIIYLYKFLKVNKIEVVCDFTGNFSALVLMTAANANIDKRVVFYRSSTDRFKKDAFRNLYNNIMKVLVKRFATDILSNSKTAMINYFKDEWKDDHRFEVIYNAVNAKSFLRHSSNLRKELNIPEDAFVIGHTGRYNPAKNHKTIVSVAENLIKKHRNIYFILCGNGVKTNIFNELESKGLLGRVLLFENRRDIPKFLNTMDCYFFPSITEGQPNALIEAMIMGLPFVASNIDPIKETVFSLDNLFDPYDVEAFTQALEGLYKERSPRNTILQQLSIKKFNSENLFNRFYIRLSR